MKRLLYTSELESLMFTMLCTSLIHILEVVSRFQLNQELEDWIAAKRILKYLQRTRDYMLVYYVENLTPIRYTYFNFQYDLDFRKSTSGSVFTLGGGAIIWSNVKKSCIADSTIKAKYMTTCEDY